MKIPEFNARDAPRVVVIGDVMLDHYAWGRCTRISPEAPVQVVHVLKETHTLGGAANVAANLAALGARSSLVGVLGDDAEHARVLRALLDSGIQTEAMVVTSTRPTTIKRRVMVGSQQIVRIDHEPTDLVSAEIEDELIAHARRLVVSASVFVLSDYAKGVLTTRVTESIIEICRAQGVPVVVDPKGRDHAKYRGATVVTPNRKEAAVATGRSLSTAEAVAAAGRELRENLSLTACLITMSEQGMALFEAGRETLLPTEAREVN